jgi:hypothetical protein
MKRSLVIVAAVAALVLAVTAVRALAGDETVTITGMAKCAKCALHQTKDCQTVIQAEKDGKTVTYYLVDNDASKAFHGKVCMASKKVTATGTVKEVDGKMQLTATKIEPTE